jgi:hypothetical protein
MKKPNKLEYLSLASLSSLMLCNSLAYWADSKVMKKMKCEYGPRLRKLLLEAVFTGDNVKVLTAVIYEYSWQVFQPSLMFVGKSKSLP